MRMSEIEPMAQKLVLNTIRPNRKPTRRPPIASVIAVVGLAYWAYVENYRTQAAIAEVRTLHTEIGQAHERLSMLRAEWAYLNRPDRLRDLADLNYKRLELMPLMPDAFGRIGDVPYPQPALLPITDPIELSSANGEEYP